MTVLAVRERDRLPIGRSDAAEAPGLTERQAEALERLTPALPAGTLVWERRAVRIGRFCGVLRAGDLTLEILPKVHPVAAGDDARGVLVAMLRSTGEIGARPAGAAGLGTQSRGLLDVFVLDFCARANALLRRGMIRRYEPREDNLTTVRGRLHLAEHLRRNALDRARLFCRFDELSADNAHNRTLRFVLTRLLGHARGAAARRAVAALLRRTEEVGHRPCSAADVARLPFDRLTEPWRPLFRAAERLLRALYPDARAGAVDGTCLLFDMERLFEAFVTTLLRRGMRGAGGRVTPQGPILPFARTDAGPVFRMRPDLTVTAPDGRVVLIVDAKWKRLDGAAPDVGVAREDIYQMAGYARRYGCPEVALVYPRGPGTAPGLVRRFTLEDGGGTGIGVYALDLPALIDGAPLPEGLLRRCS